MIRTAFLALSLFAAPVAAPAQPVAPHVDKPWVRLPAASGRPAAGYFTIHGTARPDALVAVTSPMAERIELHAMVKEGDVMRMRAQPSFEVPARGALVFAPGGSHLMLFGLSPDLKPGAAMPLTFRFRSGATATVQAETRSPGQPAAATGGHAH